MEVIEGIITYKAIDLEYTADLHPGDEGDRWTPPGDPELDYIRLYSADTDKEVECTEIFTKEAMKEIEELIWNDGPWE